MSVAATFNLLANALMSWGIGWAMMAMGLGITRRMGANTPRPLLWLPFLKVLWDLGFGLSHSWYGLTDINPCESPKGSRILSVSMGVSALGPMLDVRLNVQDSLQQMHAISLGDLLQEAMTRQVHAQLPALLVAIWVTGVVLHLAMHLRLLAANLWHLKEVRAAASLMRDADASGRFCLPVYLCALRGTPFVAGLRNPRVYFPQQTWDHLTHSERQAVLQHELGHAKARDGQWLGLVALLAVFFWFLPGKCRLLARLHETCELAADRFAVRAGQSPLHLASAIVKVNELLRHHPSSTPGCAMARPSARCTAARVRVLCGEAPSPAGRPYLCVALGVLLVGATLATGVAGNQTVQEQFPDILSPWVARQLR